MNTILIGKGEFPVHLMGRYGNRHGLIAGATGTGKTISLLVLAEGFSRMGVPVFMADVKGDAAGLAQPGETNEKITQRVNETGVENYAGEASPVVLWDLYGKLGHPVRTTISEMGPSLLVHVLALNDVQAGVMEVAFSLADDQGLLLLDLDDLRAVLSFVAENRKEISAQYGLVSAQSIAAIQRALLRFERDGGEQLFGEPALELADLMRTDMTGRGVINILAAHQLILNPRLYSGFLLWLLSELFESLPEVGDLDKPRLVFFFDEAHLLFDGAPAALKQRVEQVVRLIRSKGVGVYFCSQFPDDMPDEVLGQLGNRVQHALRAFTPRDQKAVKAAADTFVPNPRLDVASVIAQLGVGEALVSTLAEKGVPQPVQRTLVCPPRCRMGTLSDDERAAVRARSPVGAKYDMPINRESAYEMLNRRTAEKVEVTAPVAKKTAEPAQVPSVGERLSDMLWGDGRRQGVAEAMIKSAARTAGNRLGKQILRGILGGILGSGKR
ncbi:helicase HerA-like domain-containing protein [Halomonas halocynthiae]|uniref:helicase HerA-like domain-containing protein n=1 Tax=Halomonas halocynthiae TaxID=176290 RepID=UPI0004276C10|nr:helicase HerA-like domain-containing protein [Halomonas halocynthiae]